ncbi:PREDICTED: uncharacterized protein LOC106819816, partial [Priapulus caudatus]|uniref:Uncharacterized protein LOC106819816 n=1 Tax=Priapulus caudatus TaxID=37621 RepID=A0ABM1F612_PRICU
SCGASSAARNRGRACNLLGYGDRFTEGAAAAQKSGGDSSEADYGMFVDTAAGGNGRRRYTAPTAVDGWGAPVAAGAHWGAPEGGRAPSIEYWQGVPGEKAVGGAPTPAAWPTNKQGIGMWDNATGAQTPAPPRDGGGNAEQREEERGGGGGFPGQMQDSRRAIPGKNANSRYGPAFTGDPSQRGHGVGVVAGGDERSAVAALAVSLREKEEELGRARARAETLHRELHRMRHEMSQTDFLTKDEVQRLTSYRDAARLDYHAALRFFVDDVARLPLDRRHGDLREAASLLETTHARHLDGETVIQEALPVALDAYAWWKACKVTEVRTARAALIAPYAQLQGALETVQTCLSPGGATMEGCEMPADLHVMLGNYGVALQTEIEKADVVNGAGGSIVASLSALLHRELMTEIASIEKLRTLSGECADVADSLKVTTATARRIT